MQNFQVENGEGGTLLQMDLIYPKIRYFSTHSTNTEFSIVARAVNLVCFLGACIKDCVSLQASECMLAARLWLEGRKGG